MAGGSFIDKIIRNRLEHLGASFRNLAEHEVTRKLPVKIEAADTPEVIAKKMSTKEVPLRHIDPKDRGAKAEVLEGHARKVAKIKADNKRREAEYLGKPFDEDEYLKVYDKTFKHSLADAVNQAGGPDDRIFTTPHGWAVMSPDIADRSNSIYSLSLNSEGKKGGGGQNLYDAMLSATRNLGETNYSHNLLDKNPYRKLTSVAGQNLRFGDANHIDFEPGLFVSPHAFVPSHAEFKSLSPDEQLGYLMLAERDHVNQGVNYSTMSRRGLDQFRGYMPEEPLATPVNYNENRKWIDAVISGKANAARQGTAMEYGIGDSSIRRAMLTDSLLMPFERPALGLKPPSGGHYFPTDEVEGSDFYKGLFKKGGLARVRLAEGGRSEYGHDALTPTPQNGFLGWLAEQLKYGRGFINDVMNKGGRDRYGMQIGDLMLGKMPEEVEHRSYGAPAMHGTEMGVGPVWYPGRAESMADTVMNLGPTAGGLARAAGRGAKTVGRAAGEALTDAVNYGSGPLAKIAPVMAPSIMPMNAIKPKGGNWVKYETPSGKGYSGLDETFDTLTNSNALVIDQGTKAFNDWTNKNFKRYVQTHMGSPEDPLLPLYNQGMLPHVRDIHAGGGGSWDDVVDPLFQRGKASNHEDMMEEAISLSDGAEGIKAPQWLKDLKTKNPDAELFDLYPGFDSYQHLDTMLQPVHDYLRTLPPETLKNISVPEAFRQSHLWHEAMKKKAAAEDVGEMFKGTEVHKEYPDGFKWVKVGVAPKLENDVPVPKDWKVEQITAGPMKGMWKATSDMRPRHEIPIESYATKEEAQKALQDSYNKSEVEKLSKVGDSALDREGRHMGHCVGSYCDQVRGGRTEIYSLRDAQGNPHVTVEVRPKTLKSRNNGATIDDPITVENIYSINQIKGKQNKAPVDKYLPYVQDFVKSGKWGEVRDLQNSGLVRMEDGSFKTIEEAANSGENYYLGRAHGGQVKSTTNIDKFIHRINHA